MADKPKFLTPDEYSKVSKSTDSSILDYEVGLASTNIKINDTINDIKQGAESLNLDIEVNKIKSGIKSVSENKLDKPKFLTPTDYLIKSTAVEAAIHGAEVAVASAAIAIKEGINKTKLETDKLLQERDVDKLSKKLKKASETSADFGFEPGSLAFLKYEYEENGEKKLIEENYYIIDKLNIKKEKSIIKTEIINNKGTIKELLQTNDYEINFEVLLIGNAGVDYGFTTYSSFKPLEDLKILLNTLSVNKSLPIYHKSLNELGIYNIVVKSYNLVDDNENKNIYRVTVEADADNVDLKIITV